MAVASPPRPPTQDQTEALIPEARERQRRRRLLVLVIVVVAGSFVSWFGLRLGDSTPMTLHAPTGGRSGLSSSGSVVVPKTPAALAIAPSGDLLVIDRGRDQILERLLDGRFRVFAGTGKVGFSGDGGQAVDAELGQPSAMGVGPHGSVYVADAANNRIRKIALDGTITTVVGNGKEGWTPDGGKAASTPITAPLALTFSPRGRLYVANGSELVRINRNGTLTRIAGTRGPEGIAGLGRPAIQASIDGADGLAFDRAGNLYLAGFNTKTLLMIDRRGIMRAPLGTELGFSSRGSGGLTTTPSGDVFAIETQRLVQLSPQGEKTLYSFGRRKVGVVTGFLPAGIAVARSGLIYADTGFGNGWSTGSAIVALSSKRHRPHTLWSHRGA